MFQQIWGIDVIGGKDWGMFLQRHRGDSWDAQQAISEMERLKVRYTPGNR